MVPALPRFGQNPGPVSCEKRDSSPNLVQRRPLRCALALTPRALDQLEEVINADTVAIEQKVKDRVAEQIAQFRFAVDIAHLAFPFSIAS
jgi:hypothetical protein